MALSLIRSAVISLQENEVICNLQNAKKSFRQNLTIPSSLIALSFGTLAHFVKHFFVKVQNGIANVYKSM